MAKFHPVAAVVVTETAIIYFEQVVPLGVNLTQQLNPIIDVNKEFIPSMTRVASGLYSSDDTKVQKVFLHIAGVAVNTYAYANGLNCERTEDNQWQMNLDGGAWIDLVNDINPDGQMLNNDWRTPLEGGIHSFHLMFDVTDQVTNIDGKIGVRLQKGRSLQDSLYVTASIFLRILWVQ